jgi:hypothetical protein
MGVSRSASTVIAYAMKEFGWPLEKAYNYVKQKRSIARPNAGFMRQLSEYEGILDARWVPAWGFGLAAASAAKSLPLWGAGVRRTAIVWALISGFQEGSVLVLLAHTESFLLLEGKCLTSHSRQLTTSVWCEHGPIVS